MSSCEGAFDVAEEFAFEELMRHGRAVDLDERAITPRTRGVDDVRDELLADARFALDQHRRLRLRDRLQPREHFPERRTLADDAAEIHRDLHLLAEVVTLALELFAQAGVFLERGQQLSLRLIALGHILAGHEQGAESTVLVPVRGRGNQHLDHIARLGDEFARLVQQQAVSNDVFEMMLRQTRPCPLAHEIRDRATDHFLTAIAELFQPVIADIQNSPFSVDGMQHRRSRPIQVPVMLLELDLPVDLRIARDRAQKIAGLASFGHGTCDALHRLARFREQVDRRILEAAGPAQQRQILFFDQQRRLRARQIVRLQFGELLPRIAETRDPGIADIAEEPALVQ